VIIGEYGGECSQLGKQVPPTFFMVSKTTWSLFLLKLWVATLIFIMIAGHKNGV
jgi:hypothetical protein